MVATSSPLDEVASPNGVEREDRNRNLSCPQHRLVNLSSIGNSVRPLLGGRRTAREDGIRRGFNLGISPEVLPERRTHSRLFGALGKFQLRSKSIYVIRRCQLTGIHPESTKFHSMVVTIF